MRQLFLLAILFLGSMACLREPGRPGDCLASDTTEYKHPNAIQGWHPRKRLLSELCLLGVLQPGRLYIAAHSDFASPVLVKLALDDNDQPDLDHEVAVYQALWGTDITPEMHGHVIGGDEHSIGFMMEYIRPAPATTADYRGCRAVLRALHQHGIVHGDAHTGNCLPRPDGTAVLVDFELSQFMSDTPDALQESHRDLDIMQRCIDAMTEVD